MPRKPRIDKLGFYHIINRGVAKTNIFSSDEEYIRFLEIMEDVSLEYRFEIYSFCLMSNHYHLLLKTYGKNLSVVMQKINSRYSIYFNHKYKRVGPLWQGRFKSWFVFDEVYLQTLIKYIEYNPIKANIAQKISEYPWSMSSRNIKFSILNFQLLDGICFEKELNEDEQKKLNSFLSAKLQIQEDSIFEKERASLESYFTAHTRESAIFQALSDGYTQKDIGAYLGLSHVAISKITKIYKQKVKLFQKLRDKGIFWSYSKDVTYTEMGSKLFVEYLLKYGDFDDIGLGFELFGKRYMKIIWEEKLASDKQFIKTNLMLARVFFGMDVESDYFKGRKNERFEKLKLLAS